MKKLIQFITVLVMALSGVAVAEAHTSLFTYQGRLNDGAAAGTGTYQMQFALFDAASGGGQIGSTITFDGTSNPAVAVNNGIFTVQLDFGTSPFSTGADRFLQIAVKHAADPGYTTLAPRQQLTSSPFSIRTLGAGTADALSSNCVGCVTNAQINGVDGSKVTGTVANATNAANATTATTANSASTAANADNATNLNNQPASSYVLTSDSRLTDSRAPTAGSSFYIQNQTASTQTGDFNISGTGTANIFNAATEFDLGGTRMLSADLNNENVLLGQFTVNGSGVFNSFFGAYAGGSNTSGSNNSFFGTETGLHNTTGTSNSIFGAQAGFTNTGSRNSFFGHWAGVNTNQGNDNVAMGDAAGQNNASGSNNTALGSAADFASNNLLFASAIGSRAAVGANDTIVLGKTAGTYNSVSRPADSVVIPGTLTVNGGITGSLTGTATNFSGSLSGVVTGTQGATTIANNTLTAGMFGTGQVVKSLNGLHDAVTLNGGGATTISTGSSSITISTTAVTAVNAGNGISVTTGTTPAVSVTYAGSAASSATGRTAFGTATTVARSDHSHLGESWVCSGTGCRGLQLATNATDVNSAGLYAQLNQNAGPDAQGTGIWGVSWSPSNQSSGVFGQATATTTGAAAKGVWGESQGPAGIAVYGHDASAGTTGKAGQFDGNVQINGNLQVNGTVSKSGGSFKIDHPLDPDNKYLSHSFVESPDMMNIYNGNVVTDTNGDATITLPEWFEALNRDFRYQLTVIGQFAQVIVAQEIVGNQFGIKTDKPNVRVSWQVTGIRHDKFADDHRIPVEEAKTTDEQGKCLYAPACGSQKPIMEMPASTRTLSNANAK